MNLAMRMRSTGLLRAACWAGVFGIGLAASSTGHAAIAHALPPAVGVAAGLDSPWGMAFLPDGRMLVTERPGRIRLLSADTTRLSPPIQGVPTVDRRGHGGLLDVTVDPRFASNRLVYFSYTEAGDGEEAGRNSLVVARARLSEDGARLDRLQVLFRQLPRVESSENLGGRLAISRDGFLFITVGDRRVVEERQKAQDLSSYNGKTLRLRTDGSLPPDNPFVGRPGALPAIWTLGHRNPQGAFVHPRSGELWIAEHGPFGGDEINIARRGRNYGWPVVTFGCEYGSCAPIGEGTEKPGMEPPLTYWERPGIAPSNLMLYDGARFGAWRGNVLVGALAGRAVWRLELVASRGEVKVVRRERLYAELGERIRDVKQGPDGSIYLLTDGGNARIVRIGGPDPWRHL
jgi:glucose/arabinose dehydrogenase